MISTINYCDFVTVKDTFFCNKNTDNNNGKIRLASTWSTHFGFQTI